MKRFILFLTALSMTLMFLTNMPINVSAETITGDGYSFDTATGVMTITANNEVKFYSTPPFSNDISIIKDVKFEENVTTIGYNAFYQCTGLTSVIIPNNVTYIATNAFALCDGIKQVFFPASTQTQPSSFPGCPRVMYEVDADGNVVIQSIGYSSRKGMVIPNVIEGVGTVVSVADTALWIFISPSGHDHFGGTATCQKLAQCAICGTGHGEFGEHTLVDGICSVCGSIVINETKFPDANFRAYVSENFDGDKDGYLTKSECDSVTTISVSNKSISHLKGIEYFTKLTSLECDNNQLTSLDVSKNTALTSLNCSYNEITVLNVSHNSLLTALYCNNNQLTSLDLSGNTALTTLKCSGNNYTVSTCVLEPAALPGEFDISKASGWTNANVTDDNKILYLGANGAAYTYDCGSGKTASFTLKFRPHNCTKTEAQDATCTDDGNIEYYSCSVCGYKFGKEVPTETTDILTAEDIVTNATDHDYGSWTITEEPTLTETGEAERVCANDSTHKEKEFLPVLTDTSVWTKDESQHIEPTEENAGKDVYTSEYGEVEVSLSNKEHTHTLIKTEEKAPACTEDGNEAYWTCSDCGKMFSDENGTTEISEKPVIPATEHNYGSWTITEEPTLTETGEAERVCANDSTHKEKEFLPVLTDTSVWTKDESQHIEPTEENTGKDVYISEYGEVEVTLSNKEHTHTLIKTEEKAPSCTEDGSEAYWTCSDCGKMFSDENGVNEIDEVVVIRASGHTEVIDPAVPATCTAAGKTEGSHCSACSEVLTEQKTVPALGHTEVTDAAIAATCTTYGKTEGKHCSVCKTVITAQTTVPKTGHAWDNGIVTTPATEDREGVKTFTCSKCNETRTETIPPLNHVHTLVHHAKADADCVNTGTVEYWSCSACGNNYGDEAATNQLADITIPAKGHTEVTDAAVAAACTTDGKTEGKHCSVCNTVITAQTIVPATGHAWDNGIVTTEPTESAEGVKTFTCTVCRETKTEKIPAAGGTVTPDTPSDGENGSVITEVKPGENAPITELKTPKDELIDAILTPEEKEQADNGVDIKIILKVEDGTNSAPAEDKEKVEREISRLTNYRLGQYLDIELLKVIGGKQENITQTKSEITITFEIPANLRGKQSYSIIRVHEGETTVLADEDNNTDTITIKTDKFSTYALAYGEKNESTPPNGGNTGGNRPEPPIESEPSESETSAPNESEPTTSETSAPSESEDTPSESGGSSDSETAQSSEDNSSANVSDTDTSNSTPSGDENNSALSESTPNDKSENPATGIAVSFIPLTASFAAVLTAVYRKKNR